MVLGILNIFSGKNRITQVGSSYFRVQFRHMHIKSVFTHVSKLYHVYLCIMYVLLALVNPFHIIYFDPKGNSFRRSVVDGVADDQYRRRNGLGDKPLRIASTYSNHVETLMTL